MLIFVTGICGYLGRAISREAGARGHQVIGIDRVPWPGDEPLPSGTKVIQGSLEEGSEIAKALRGCDALIHGAGLHLNNGRHLPLARFIHVNVTLTAELLDSAIAAGVRRFALCSSMSILAGTDWTHSGMGVLTEELPGNPTHPYPISKLMVEDLGRRLSGIHGVSIGSLRPMSFGHGGQESGLSLLARCLSARDAALAALLAVEHGGLKGEVFNIGSGSPLTNLDIADAQLDPSGVLERVYPGCRATLDALGTKPNTTDFWPVCSNVRARERLGYQPRDTFAAWLRSSGWPSA